MKKIMILALMLSTGMACADELYRPINFTFTNAISAWTNTVDNPVILKNLIVGSGVSNENVTVKSVSLGTSITNTVIAATSNSAHGTTSPIILAVPLELGDSLIFETTYSLTNRVDIEKKHATIILEKNSR